MQTKVLPIYSLSFYPIRIDAAMTICIELCVDMFTVYACWTYTKKNTMIGHYSDSAYILKDSHNSLIKWLPFFIFSWITFGHVNSSDFLLLLATANLFYYSQSYGFGIIFTYDFHLHFFNAKLPKKNIFNAKDYFY